MKWKATYSVGKGTTARYPRTNFFLCYDWILECISVISLQLTLVPSYLIQHSQEFNIPLCCSHVQGILTSESQRTPQGEKSSMVLKWFLHSHLTGKREHPSPPPPHTLDSPSPRTLGSSISHLQVRFTPPHSPGIFDLRRMSKMSNWTTPFRRIFGDNQSTKMASNWPLWRKAKHSQANRISRQHFRLSFPSLPSRYLLYDGSCLVHFVALQGSWIDSTFYIDNRCSTFSAHRRFCGHILIVSGLSCL